MSDCILCDILNKKTSKLELDENTVLYEDNLLEIIPAKGAPVSGWILLVIKKHINGFAELKKNELLHVERVIKKVKKIYKRHFKIKSIILEHGSTNQGRHPQSIVHAHMHMIPFNFDHINESLLFEYLKLKSINSIKDLIKNKNMDYWLYINPDGKLYTSSNISNVPRSIFMNLVAKQIHFELPYEWRNTSTNQIFIKEVVDIFKDNI